MQNYSKIVTSVNPFSFSQILFNVDIRVNYFIVTVKANRK